MAAMIKLGLTLRETGQVDEAMDVLKQCVKLDPESADLHYQLGLLFADRSEFTLALEQFEYATSKQPQNIDCVANIALSLQNMGLVNRAQAGWQTLSAVAEQQGVVPELLRD
jgi:Tfp pilus assembly protein PilF